SYQIRDSADSVADVLGDVKVLINHDAPADKRSYRVDFSRWESIAPSAQPMATLESTILELVEGLGTTSGLDASFRFGPFMRLQVLSDLREAGHLDDDLRWTTQGCR